MAEPFYLRELQALNFKNFVEVDLLLNSQINCFIGSNGSGKTNLLDAIYYLSFCKSYFNTADVHVIKFDEQFFSLKGDFLRNEQSNIIHCAVRKGQKKQFKKNRKEYEKLAEHIGQYPAVIISPYDTDLIKEGSETRRKFIDIIIGQLDRHYLNDVMRYQKILKQRNALLKNFSEMRIFDQESIAVWDEQLIPLGTVIFQKRKDFINDFVNTFKKHYEDLSDKKEDVGIEYHSQLFEKPFDELLKESSRKDEMAQYTTQGIHKDDLNFMLKGQAIKKFGSQGQQKTFLIALRLAQFEYLTKFMHVKPLLLLDDIFDKLDQQRVENLMEKVSKGIFGQVFVSDTDISRINSIFKKFDREKISVFSVENGRIQEQKEEPINA